ncbi:hypothetical protein [Methylophilus sp. Leaf408]|uniref:hypothetical protein n=1 Tax=Methylophilus sp. Leaf408 TaxID=2876561 RepID=UPI001E526BF5|nr:hypothetical protein [Methylophilus sp. Leaf408]
MQAKTSYLFIVLCLIVGSVQGGEVKHVPLSQIMAGSVDPAAPKDKYEPAITIPAHYISKKIDGAAMPAVVLGVLADVESVIPEWKFDEIKEGIFTINLSPYQTYDQGNRKFRGESQNAVKEYEMHGFKNAKIRREDSGGVPVLSITSEKDGRPNYLAFIAIGSSVMAINYVPPTPATADDNKRWETFIHGVSPENLK